MLRAKLVSNDDKSTEFSVPRSQTLSNSIEQLRLQINSKLSEICEVEKAAKLNKDDEPNAKKSKR